MKRDVPGLQTRLRIAHYLPKLWKINLAVVVLVVGVLLVWPLSDSSRSSRLGWSAGPVTNHHRLIEPTCDRCHDVAFEGVPDTSCVGCHDVSDHASSVPGIVSTHTELGNRCVSCHKEHHGQESLIPVQSALCTECHNRIDELGPDTEQPRFENFQQHPEFAVEVWTGDPPKLRKIRLGEPGLRALTQLKFSHARHLSLPDEPLLCSNCHEFGDHRVQPITFVKHCETCHTLKFDDGIDSPSIPHRDATRVYAFVRWEIARQYLVNGTKSAVSDTIIGSESRDAESGLFTRGGDCVRCHDVHDVVNAKDNQSRFRIEPPRQSRPMVAAVFDHNGHRFTPCEQCHQGIKESRSAGDLLLPSISVCRECHADPGTAGKVDSPCLQCHNYHEMRR